MAHAFELIFFLSVVTSVSPITQNQNFADLVPYVKLGFVLCYFVKIRYFVKDIWSF